MVIPCHIPLERYIPDKTLDDMARTKVERYRRAQSLSAGAIRNPILHCLDIGPGPRSVPALALHHRPSLHHRLVSWQRLGTEEPGNDAFTWRRGEYFYHNRAASGLAITIATLNAHKWRVTPNIPAILPISFRSLSCSPPASLVDLTCVSPPPLPNLY